MEQDIKPKEVDFARGYLVYPDGRVFSEISNKFLKPQHVIGKLGNKRYYRYDLGTNWRCLASRLVMYCWGDHNYTRIDDMPKVSFKDLNPSNHHIDNLEFVTQGEINKRYGIKCSEETNKDKGTIKLVNLDKVKTMLAEGKTYKAIGAEFGASEMSVYRFVKHHIKNRDEK